MKNIFFTADWHLFHHNVLIFCSRPFKDLSDMHTKLVGNYNSTVNENSVCYFLGDFGRGPQKDMEEIVRSLKGTKVLILGNHDKNTVGFYYRVGFDVVLNAAVIYIGKNRISLSHCPLLGKFREDTTNMRNATEGENWYGENRIGNKRFIINDNADFHFHGHIHSPNQGKSVKIEGNQFDMGVDANGYRPVSLSMALSWMDRYKKERREEE